MVVGACIVGSFLVTLVSFLVVTKLGKESKKRKRRADNYVALDLQPRAINNSDSSGGGSDGAGAGEGRDRSKSTSSSLISLQALEEEDVRLALASLDSMPLQLPHETLLLDRPVTLLQDRPGSRIEGSATEPLQRVAEYSFHLTPAGMPLNMPSTTAGAAAAAAASVNGAGVTALGRAMPTLNALPNGGGRNMPVGLSSFASASPAAVDTDTAVVAHPFYPTINQDREDVRQLLQEERMQQHQTKRMQRRRLDGCPSAKHLGVAMAPVTGLPINPIEYGHTRVFYMSAENVGLLTKGEEGPGGGAEEEEKEEEEMELGSPFPATKAAS